MNKTLEAIVCAGLLAAGCREASNDIERWLEISNSSMTNKFECTPLSWVQDYVEYCETGYDNCIEDPLCVVGDSINITIGVEYTTEMDSAPVDEINFVKLNEYHGDTGRNIGDFIAGDLSLEDTTSFQYTETRDSVYTYETTWKPQEYNITCSGESYEFDYLLTALIDYTIPVEEDYSVTTQREENIAAFLFVYDHNCLE